MTERLHEGCGWGGGGEVLFGEQQDRRRAGRENRGNRQLEVCCGCGRCMYDNIIISGGSVKMPLNV